MKTGVAMVMAAIGLLTLMCCRRTSIAPAEDYDGTQRLVNSAIADLAGQLDVARTEIAVQSVEATEFPDASLGVPEPGKMYAQVITPGYIIRLAVDGEVYQYHGSGDQVVSVPRNEGSNPTGDRITIDHVQIKVGGQISFSGRTTLPEGTCLQAQLLADDDPVNWWPRDTCVEVQQGDWEVSMPLPEDDGPEALGTSTQYRLRMWQRAQPSVESWFHFDLAGPPMPEE
jgi:hypothetical protein